MHGAAIDAAAVTLAFVVMPDHVHWLLELKENADLGKLVTIARETPQHESRLRLLSHLFEHQIHHRGQVHGMLSGTPVAPPQLDEFFSVGEAPLRAEEFAELGWTEEKIWGDASS